MAKPLAIDNSKLREEARQQRREQARLQQPPEKQPTKNLFGPPIPVSRPNDPTFEQLSNFFGSPVGADIWCFRSLSNNDCSPTDRSSQGHRPAVMRHGDARDATEHSNSRRAEHRQNESRHGGDAKQADARQGDTRHGDIKHRDSRPRDGRNIGSGEPTVRSSRPGRGTAVAAPLLDVEPSRQGVFEQFVKSSSKTPSTVESDGVATKALGARQSAAHGKTKHRTSSFNDSKSEELSSECRLTGFKPESQSKQQPAAYQSKCSSDSVPDPFQNVSPSSFPSGRMNGVRKEMNGSPPDRRTTFGKGNEKLSGDCVNGIHQGLDLNGKNSEVEKKLKLHISKEYEKCDDLVTKVLQAVTIRSPLTGILTPKKTDFPFSFPDATQQLSETIPEGFPSSDEDDGREVVMVDHGSVQRPERLCDYAGKTIPNQSSSVLHDLNISDSSDSENEQVEENSVAQRTPGCAGQSCATDPKLSWAVPSTGNAKGRRPSESSEASSTEGSCTSGSESDTSQSDNEDDGTVKQTGSAVKDENDEAEAKQFKRTSWEIKNFLPRGNDQVPFILSSSLPPSPPFAGVNRQMSNSGFDIDINDPIKEMYMMSPKQVLSPLTSDVERAESCHSPDVIYVICPSSPKIPLSPRIAVNGPRPVDLPADLSRMDSLPSSVRESKSCAFSPEHGSSFLAPISGVEYHAGNPSVIVRIRRSYILKKAKKAKHGDSASNDICGTTGTTQVGTLAVSSRSATPRSQAQTGRGPDVLGYSPESAVKSNGSLALDTSMPKNSSCHSSHTRMPESTPEQTSIALVPSSFELMSAARKESGIESSPAKCNQDETATDIMYPISSKATKRKLDDIGRLDSKKICDRRKEDRKSQPSQLQNGNPNNSQRLLVVAPDFKIEPKSPTVNGEDNNSRSSSSSSSSHVQKRTERTKSQNGRSRPDDKTRKTSSEKVNGKVSDSETLNSVSSRSAKGSTPVVNGIGESPSNPNPDICGENGLSISGDLDDIGKRTRDHDGDVDRLTFGQKNSLNGIKRFKFEPEKLESSDFYMRNARRLKHEGDSRPDKFVKVLNYTESVLAFFCHCSALEAEHAELARVQKMYQDTLALCQYVVRVMESVVGPEKYHLIAINLRIQAIINLRLYSIRKADVAKLKSVLDEHNKSHMSKPLQIPSPYQTNHLHSTNNTPIAAAAVSWNHANGTPSPRSPRPSPSPAGSIGSVGSAGSSNGDNTGMVKPLSVVNGHSLTSIVVPQRIHSVMMNFVNYMNYLHQCLDCWDQAEAILVTHPAVGDFFHSVDSEFGPIDLHSSALAIVHYASKVVTHVQSEVKRTSQVVRTD